MSKYKYSEENLQNYTSIKSYSTADNYKAGVFVNKT
jgi:hypothetical protein